MRGAKLTWQHPPPKRHFRTLKGSMEKTAKDMRPHSPTSRLSTQVLSLSLSLSPVTHSITPIWFSFSNVFTHILFLSALSHTHIHTYTHAHGSCVQAQGGRGVCAAVILYPSSPLGGPEQVRDGEGERERREGERRRQGEDVNAFSLFRLLRCAILSLL